MSQPGPITRVHNARPQSPANPPDDSSPRVIGAAAWTDGCVGFDTAVQELHNQVISRIFSCGLLLEACRQLTTGHQIIDGIERACSELDCAIFQLQSSALTAALSHASCVAVGEIGTDMPTNRASKPKTVQVTFTLPLEIEAHDVSLCGEFNNWSTDGTKLIRESDGCWRATVSLEPGRAYRYRYLLDGQRWENAWDADDYVPNPYGGEDSVVVVGDHHSPNRRSA